ncbi:histone-lysine N-methyltransferase SETMAR [Plakobranchus ocellatus]|uniref:Histone-lysine N-methyltransferase SETMAR n=1 Tax=Plakobranchus ocellatus TaxID=259542 RepID=A0AAV4AAI8_9GAST|nr:histone-lysine N-methyltransferase SETMAR [Plakobranchus ocellatus]
MSVFPISITLIKQVITYKVCRGVTLYKSFVQERNTRSSRRTERDTVGPRLPVVFAMNGKRRFSMFCPNAGKWPVTEILCPDLAPSDFHLFGPLKCQLGGMAFETEDDLISELRNWFDNLDVDFFPVGINSLLSRWQKCIGLHGDYAEK